MKAISFFKYIKTLFSANYRRELRRYILLLLIPVILLVALYISVYQVITQQIDDHAQLTINYFYTQSNAMLQEIQHVSSILKNNSIILSSLKPSNIDDTFQPLTVCHEISVAVENSPYAQHVYLIDEATGKIYSDQGAFNADSLNAILTNLGISDLAMSKSNDEGTAHILNENQMAPYYISSVIGMGGQDLGTLIITFRMTEFLNIFYSLNSELCAIFNDDVYIATNFNRIDIDNFNWYSEADISALVNSPVKCTYLETEDYTYVVAVSRTAFYQPLIPILYAFALYLIAVMLLGYLTLSRISKKRAKNIENLISMLPEVYQGNHSYQEIYAGIRASLQEYKNQYEQYQAWKKERLLHEMLSNRMSKATAKQYEEVGFPSAEGYTFYTVSFFTTHIVDPSMQIDNMPQIREYVSTLFFTTISGLSNKHNIQFAFCTEHNIQIAIFYHTDSQFLKDAVRKISQGVIELLSDSYELDIKATISNPFSSPDNLYVSFSETVSLHQFAMSINSTASTISQEEMLVSSGVLLDGDFIRQEQILINTILSKKYDSVPSMVEHILSTHVAPIRKKYALAQTRLSSIANVLAEGVRMSTLSGKALDEASLLFEKVPSIQQLNEAVQQVYQELAAQNEDSATQSSIINSAYNYIVQNLNDPNLSVSVICESTGVSPQRLTRMFHIKFNMAIAEYMNYLRIEKVKELLSNPDITVIQIAEQVGYTNTDTLTRNFKKLEGITPSEYRRTQLQI